MLVRHLGVPAARERVKDPDFAIGIAADVEVGAEPEDFPIRQANAERFCIRRILAPAHLLWTHRGHVSLHDCCMYLL
jgi:hypothetical protein